MVLSFQDLMQARNLHSARHTPLINKDIMQLWTMEQATEFFKSGGLHFPASYDPNKGAPPGYLTAPANALPASPSPTPAPEAAPKPAALRFTTGRQPTKPSKWLRCIKPNPAARFRLVFFPWTGNRGGQGSVFGTQKWPAALPHAEIYEVALPGRGMRMGEPLRKDPRALADELAKEVGGALQGGLVTGFARRMHMVTWATANNTR